MEMGHGQDAGALCPRWSSHQPEFFKKVIARLAESKSLSAKQKDVRATVVLQ